MDTAAPKTLPPTMNAAETADFKPTGNQKLALRGALVCGILGILIVVLIIAAQLVWSFNPYREATAQVNYLLQTQPDLETRLDYINLASDRLQDSLDKDLALTITNTLGPAAEEQIIEFLASQGVRSSDVRTFTSLLNNVAVETLALEAELQHEDPAVPLKPLFYQIRQQPEIIDSVRLNQIYTTSPLVIEDLNDLRRRILSISNNMRLISDSAQLAPIADIITNDSSSGQPTTSPIAVYAASYSLWQAIPKAAESLEIQFASTVAVLDDIFTAVNAARLQDRRWGYSQLEPAAIWINSHWAIAAMAAFLLLLIAAMIGWRYRPVTPNLKSEQVPSISWQIARLASVLQIPLSSTRRRSAGVDRLTAPLNLAGSAAAKRRTASAAGTNANPRFLVLKPNGERETLPLTTDKAFRIGSDPRNPVFIDNREAGYIEIWVRGARASFFIEVMFSEQPVLLNREPITGARTLNEGDLIQVLDYSLLYFES
ncbi:MAG TPA: hypothetical protein VN364_01945 [Bellilinea sp.]|nr:hypothetical protein [Bellilinea sp.]